MHATRTHILNTAPAIFATHGFAGASTRQIAAAADVNIAAIAYHFGGKQGLYEAVLDDVYERILATPIPNLTSGTPADRVRTLVATVYGQAREERDGIRVLLRHVMSHGSLPSTVQDKWTPHTLAKVSEIFKQLELPDAGDYRLHMLSLNHLIARYAVSEEDDIKPFVEGDPQTEIAAHLGDLAVKLLNLH
ncbi:MAG: TetR/AcrR family transcriptional regulator [Myxococcota bacterium]